MIEHKMQVDTGCCCCCCCCLLPWLRRRVGTNVRPSSPSRQPELPGESLSLLESELRRDD